MGDAWVKWDFCGETSDRSQFIAATLKLTQASCTCSPLPWTTATTVRLS